MTNFAIVSELCHQGSQEQNDIPCFFEHTFIQLCHIMKNRRWLWTALFCLTVLTVHADKRYALGSLNLKLMTCGFGNCRANKSVDNNALRLNGKTYETGVGTHADSRLKIWVNGTGKRFSAIVGVDDEATERGSVQFRVTGDGKVLAESPVMKKGRIPFKINVSIADIDTLCLEALATDDGNNNDHADWADAWVEMATGEPQAIPSFDVIEIGTENTVLALSTDKKGNLFQQYFGMKAGVDAIFGNGERHDQAYPTIQSSSDFSYWQTPALHIIHSDGHTSTMLRYVKSETTKTDNNVTLTTVELKDPNYDFTVRLHFKTYAKEDVIEQWAEIHNNEAGDVVLKDVASAAMLFRGGDYWLTQFTGGYMNEFNVDEAKLLPGEKIFENRWGITSSNERQQHFMLSVKGRATETTGSVMAGSLKWSGNWKLNFDMSSNGNLSVFAGINNWSSDYTLGSGESFTTPELIYTFTDKGKGQASRNLHRWALNYGIRNGHKPLRTIFNNWEATGMNTADKVIIPFLAPAKELGYELFLLDDGWFGLEDKARVLGEWNPTPVMHPNGMKTIIDEAKKTGIDFGLWVEMEMANPDARLVKEHPEWLLCEPDRTPHLQRGQYVMDLSNPEVQEFCIRSFCGIIDSNPGISFVKWDCNSPFHNPYSHYLGRRQQHLWYDYTKGLYRVFGEVMRRHPKLQMMLCSAGPARNDYGALQFFHEFWTSDNTTPLARVFIQWGHSHVFPARVIGAHVTHMGHQPFKFAFDVAMSGVLGMDANPAKMTKEESEITRRAVKAYKEKLRPVVQFGDLYRLISPYETSRSVISYVEPEEHTSAALFVYQVKDETAPLHVNLQGLDPGLNYKIEEVNIASPFEAACTQNGKVMSGEDLMTIGLDFACSKRFDSAVIYLKAME